MRHTHLLSAIRQYLRKIVLFIAIFFFPNMGYAIGTLAGIYQPEIDFGKNSYIGYRGEVVSSVKNISYDNEPTLTGSNIFTNEILKQKTSTLSQDKFELFSHGRPGELLLAGQWRDAEHIFNVLGKTILTYRKDYCVVTSDITNNNKFTEGVNYERYI